VESAKDFKEQFRDPDPAATEQIAVNMTSISWLDDLRRIDYQEEQTLAQYRETISTLQKIAGTLEVLQCRRSELRNRAAAELRGENQGLEARRKQARVYHIQTVNIQNYQE